MDQKALSEELRRLRVTPPDEGRAALYLPRLRETHAFLTQALKKPPTEGLGDQYPFFSTALQNPNLLNELAAMLDLYLGPALNAEMTALNPRSRAGATTTFAQLYANAIFDPVDATYVGRVQAFLARYPTTQAALEGLTANFKRNILLACQRIAGDRSTIERLFAAEHPRLTLHALVRISSTGSDFHKGGQQVLILTFDASHDETIVVTGPRQGSVVTTRMSFTLRLVYKPSDVEIDCLVAGDSRAINAVVPQFMPASLIEIFNGLIDRQRAQFPNARPLPTYKILPRDRLSLVHPGGGPPFGTLRELYGYLEYLSYEETGTSAWLSLNDYYPFGSGDFLVFKSEGDRPQVVTDFYQQMGQLLALACTFSLKDLHLQNVRIRRLQPHLIDLEVSLGRSVDQVWDTALLAENQQGGALTGITGYEFHGAEVKWAIVPVGKDDQHERLQKEFTPKPYQNRLIKLGPGRRLVGVDPAALCQGLGDGLRILAGAPASHFDAWWERTASVLVRDLPYTTTFLSDMRNAIFFTEEYANQALVENVRAQVSGTFAGEYKSYGAGDVPRYLVLAPGICEGDFRSLDLPVFYRRVDQLDIVDSNGNAIPIPRQVTIGNALQDSKVGRATYYARGLAAELQRGLAALQGDPTALDERARTLQAQVLQALGLDRLPETPQFTFSRA